MKEENRSGHINIWCDCWLDVRAPQWWEPSSVFIGEPERSEEWERQVLSLLSTITFLRQLFPVKCGETRRNFIEPVYFAQENLGDTLKEWMSMFLWTQFYYEINHGEQFHWNICNAGEESEKFYQSKCCCEKMKNILKKYFTINLKYVLQQVSGL